MRVRALTASACALAACAGAPASAGAIVGGAAVAIDKAPYQVLVRTTEGLLCGGAVIDATHVATAAHCVVTADGSRTRAPSSFRVYAGSKTRDAGLQHLVDRVALQPDYDGVFRLDAAVLRLSTAMALVPGVTEAVALASAPPAPGELFVSGWGDTIGATTGSSYPLDLHGVALTQRSDGTCSSAYGQQYDGAVMLCAGDVAGVPHLAGRDSCGGDSGGPLTDGSPSAKGSLLHGIVSYGPAHCGSGFGVYTEVAAPAVRSFLLSDPPDAPRPSGPVLLEGLPKAGSPLTCDPGSWTGAPTAWTYQFLAQTADGFAALTPPGAGATFTPAAGDVGRTIVCTAQARNAGGWGSATSPAVQIAAVPAAVVETLPLPVQDPSPTVAEQPAPGADVSPPVARIVRGRCTRRGCTLRVRVVDLAPSAGIRSLGVRVASLAGGRRSRAKALVARPLGGGTFSVVARGLRPGRHRFTLVAVDEAGNRQPIATSRTLRVR